MVTEAIAPGERGRQMENTREAAPAGERRQTSTGRTSQAGWEPLDTHCEVATVLRSKRWEEREEPFQGFNSPPGKF